MFTFRSRINGEYMELDYEVDDSGRATFVVPEGLEEELEEVLYNYIATEDEDPWFTNYEVRTHFMR